MKKNTYLLVVLICLSFISRAQDSGDHQEEIRESLTAEEFGKALTSQLSVLLSGQENNSLGNFASVDIVDAELKFSPSFILRNGNLITAELKAGITDGISPIFSNNKLNTNISFEIAMNLGNPYSRKTLSFNSTKWDIYKGLKNGLELEKKQRLQKANDYFHEVSLKIAEFDEALIKNLTQIKTEQNQTLEKDKLESAILYNSQKITAKEKELQELSDKKKLQKLSENDNLKVAQLEFEKQSLLLENETSNKRLWELDNFVQRVQMLMDKNADIKRKKEALVELKDSYDRDLQEELIEAEFVKKYKDLKETNKLEVMSVSMDWYTISYKVKNDAFNLFESTLPFEDQIEKLNEVSHEFGLQHSIYNYEFGTSFKTFYLSNGLNFAFTNNLSDLDKIEVVDTRTEINNSTQRESQTKTSALFGELENDIKKLSLFSDLYYFLYENKFAIHINPVHKIRNKNKPQTDFTIGLLFAFKNSDKDVKSPVNVEAFYNFLDVFKNTESDLKLFERNNIGLRFTFPINFKQN